MSIFGSQPYAAFAASGVNQGVLLPFRAADDRRANEYLNLAREREARYAQQYEFQRQQEMFERQAMQSQMQRRAMVLDAEGEFLTEAWQKGKLSDGEYKVAMRRNAMGELQVGGIVERMQKREAQQQAQRGPDYGSMIRSYDQQARLLEQQAKNQIDPRTGQPNAQGRESAEQAQILRNQQLMAMQSQHYQQTGQPIKAGPGEMAAFEVQSGPGRLRMREDNPHMDFGPMTPEERQAEMGSGGGQSANVEATARQIAQQVQTEMKGATPAAIRAEAERRLKAAGIDPS